MSNVIDCPECGADSGVVDSRESESKKGFKEGARRRRRWCNHCPNHFTTYEVSAETVDRMDDLLKLLGNLVKTTKCFDFDGEL